MMMVNGPSLTRCTCMSAAKMPVFDVDPVFSENRTEFFVEHFCPLRCLGPGETGAVSLPPDGSQGKLADNEHFSAFLRNIEVRFTLGIGKYAHFCSFMRKVGGFVDTVVLLGAEQDQQAWTNRADDFIVDRDRRFRYPLQDRLNATPPPDRVEFCAGSSFRRSIIQTPQRPVYHRLDDFNGHRHGACS